MKTFATTTCILLAFGCYVSGQVIDTVKVGILSPVEFLKSIQSESNPIIVDVREFFEFRKSRLKSAVNIPSSGNLEISADTIDKKCALYFYCTTGYRSKRVAKYFANKGFEKLYSLEGGIVAWRKEHLQLDWSRVRKVASSSR
jgi:thioredoxin 1